MEEFEFLIEQSRKDCCAYKNHIISLQEFLRRSSQSLSQISKIIQDTRHKRGEGPLFAYQCQLNATQWLQVEVGKN